MITKANPRESWRRWRRAVRLWARRHGVAALPATYWPNAFTRPSAVWFVREVCGGSRRGVAEVDVIDHGITWPDYFQGAGVAFTSFDECATGCGDTFAEAIDDALEQAADSGVNVAQLEQMLRDECATHSGDWPESESASASVEPEAPEDSFRVAFHAFCGMSFDIVDDASRDDARRAAAARLRALRRRGQTVTILTRGESWESVDPDDSAMVSDNAGTLTLADETPEAPEVDDWPLYYVSIRWQYA